MMEALMMVMGIHYIPLEVFQKQSSIVCLDHLIYIRETYHEFVDTKIKS